MSDKALTNAELELTQRMQMHFPRGVIPPKVLAFWNSCSKEILTQNMVEIYGRIPDDKQPEESLLRFLGTVTVPATTEPFVARDRFVVNTSSDATVKISGLGSNFEEWFLGKIETSMQETVLRYQKLTKSSVDVSIIAELGGEAKAEIALAQVFALMQIQKNGEAGALFNNGWANIFYVRDINGTRCTMSVCWYGDGWNMNANANSVESDVESESDGWFSGVRVFSSNS
ncbi:MAG: hypothetical protein Q8Q90_00480 [bacterium]|nr:hypothetical protein [bacterium]